MRKQLRVRRSLRPRMKEPLAIGSPSPEDMARIYGEIFREEAPKQRNLTIERMLALEAEARRRAQQAVSPENHEQD